MYSDIVEQSVEILKKFEGFRAKAYQDGGGVWTIGYGETLNVKKGDVWAQSYALERLKLRVEGFLSSVLKACPQLHLEPAERVVACVSLAYNIGVGAFSASSICRYTKSQEYTKAGKSFLLWNKDNGKVVKGLTYRREIESNMYLNC
jgi:lysozyme